MGLVEYEYIYIDNIKKLGNFSVRTNRKIDEKSILRPVYLIRKDQNNTDVFNLHPGYIDIEDTFFHCPLEIFFIQLINITQEEKKVNFRSYCRVEASLKVFSKDFSYHRVFNIHFEKENSSLLRYSILDKVINITNEYIFSGRELNKLNIEQINLTNPIPKNRLQLIRIVEDLVFDFYEDSMSRVGKDNSFWIEAEVRNLPEDRYLNNLIVENLEKQNKKIKRTDYGLLFTVEQYSEYSPANGRKKLGVNIKSDETIKKNLMLDVVFSYNIKEHLFEQISEYIELK